MAGSTRAAMVRGSIDFPPSAKNSDKCNRTKRAVNPRRRG